MEDALKVMSSKVEKNSFNELLNRVGLSKSRITASPPREEFVDQEILS